MVGGSGRHLSNNEPSVVGLAGAAFAERVVAEADGDDGAGVDPGFLLLFRRAFVRRDRILVILEGRFAEKVVAMEDEVAEFMEEKAVDDRFGALAVDAFGINERDIEDGGEHGAAGPLLFRVKMSDQVEPTGEAEHFIAAVHLELLEEGEELGFAEGGEALRAPLGAVFGEDDMIGKIAGIIIDKGTGSAGGAGLEGDELMGLDAFLLDKRGDVVESDFVDFFQPSLGDHLN